VTPMPVAFIVATNAGSLESRTAAATPTESAGVPSPNCTDVVPATATVGLASGNDRNAAPTFGYLEFEREFTDGSTATGFGPLPATVCIPTDPSTIGGGAATSPEGTGCRGGAAPIHFRGLIVARWNRRAPRASATPLRQFARSVSLPGAQCPP